MTLLIDKDTERVRLVFETRRGRDYESVQSQIAALYEARQRCSDEVWGWVESMSTDTATLESGACLAEARGK